MQVKQKWTNVTIITPTGPVLKDLVMEDDRISALLDPASPTGTDWRIIDGAGQIIFPGMIDIVNVWRFLVHQLGPIRRFK